MEGASKDRHHVHHYGNSPNECNLFSESDSTVTKFLDPQFSHLVPADRFLSAHITACRKSRRSRYFLAHQILLSAEVNLFFLPIFTLMFFLTY